MFLASRRALLFTASVYPIILQHPQLQIL